MYFPCIHSITFPLEYTIHTFLLPHFANVDNKHHMNVINWRLESSSQTIVYLFNVSFSKCTEWGLLDNHCPGLFTFIHMRKEKLVREDIMAFYNIMAKTWRRQWLEVWLLCSALTEAFSLHSCYISAGCACTTAVQIHIVIICVMIKFFWAMHRLLRNIVF